MAGTLDDRARAGLRRTPTTASCTPSTPSWATPATSRCTSSAPRTAPTSSRTSAATSRRRAHRPGHDVYAKSSADAVGEVAAAVNGVRMMYIDGEHSYDAVKEELERYAPLLSPRRAARPSTTTRRAIPAWPTRSTSTSRPPAASYVRPSRTTTSWSSAAVDIDIRMRARRRGVDTDRVPTTSHWLAFLVASILFIQVPGPSLLFTIGRALTVGRRDALLSVAGNGIGVMVQVRADRGRARCGGHGQLGGVRRRQGDRGVVRHLARHPGDPAPRPTPRRSTHRSLRSRAGRRGRCAPGSSSASPTRRRWCSSWRSCRSSSTPTQATSGCR